MSSKTALLGPLEQQIMDVLWTSVEPLKPSDVLRRLAGDHAYTTVMTVLTRLADKKLICRDLQGKAYFYPPCQTKNEFIKNHLSDIFSGLVNSYGGLAISQFVESLKATDSSDLDLLKQY